MSITRGCKLVALEALNCRTTVERVGRDSDEMVEWSTFARDGGSSSLGSDSPSSTYERLACWLYSRGIAGAFPGRTISKAIVIVISRSLQGNVMQRASTIVLPVNILQERCETSNNSAW